MSIKFDNGRLDLRGGFMYWQGNGFEELKAFKVTAGMDDHFGVLRSFFEASRAKVIGVSLGGFLRLEVAGLPTDLCSVGRTYLSIKFGLADYVTYSLDESLETFHRTLFNFKQHELPHDQIRMILFGDD